MITGCCIKSNQKISVNLDFNGYSKDINEDTLTYPNLYPLGEIHLKVRTYDYVETKDSIHIFFHGLFSTKSIGYIKYCSFNFISDNKLLLNNEEMLTSYDGKFKIVIPKEESTLNVVIKSYEYGYAFASYKINIK